MTEKKAGRKKAAGKQDFEKSLARLETIVTEMESGSLGLEDMIARFEEGQALLKFCSGKLNEVERKIEILVSKEDEVVAEPFDSSAQPETEGAGDEAQEEAGEETLF